MMLDIHQRLSKFAPFFFCINMDIYNKLNISIPKPDWDDIEKTIARVCVFVVNNLPVNSTNNKKN